MLPYGDSAPTKDITISGIGVSTTITLGGLDGFKALEVVGFAYFPKDWQWLGICTDAES
jgi:hypothetical protein